MAESASRFESFEPDGGTWLQSVRAALQRSRFVQVSGISSEALAQAMPDALSVDLSVAGGITCDLIDPWKGIFGSHAGATRQFGPRTGVSFWKDVNQGETTIHQSACDLLWAEWEAFRSLPSPTVILHSLPPTAVIERSISDWNPLPNLLAVDLIAEQLSEFSGDKAPSAVLLNSDFKLNLALARLRGTKPSDYHFVEGLLLYRAADYRDRIADLPLFLFSGADPDLASLLADWLDVEEPAWRDDWTSAIRRLRVMMLPDRLFRGAADQEKEAWASRFNHGKVWNTRTLLKGATERFSELLLRDEEERVSVYYSGDGMQDYDVGLIAAAVRGWVNGGRFFAPPSWVDTATATDSNLLLPGAFPAGLPCRPRSIPHGWLSKELTWNLVGLYVMTDLRDPVDDLSSQSLSFLRSRQLACVRDADEVTAGWLKFLSESQEADRLSLFAELSLDVGGLDSLNAARLLSALRPEPPEAWRRHFSVRNNSPASKPGTCFEMPPIAVTQSLVLAEAVVRQLGDDGCRSFLEENLPSAGGEPTLCVMEWLLSQEFAERIADPLAAYLGFEGVRRLAAEFGVEASSPRPAVLLAKVCIAKGIPPLPEVSGPRSALQRTREAVDRILVSPGVNVEELRRAMQDGGLVLESALKQILYVQARLFRWFEDYLRLKLPQSGRQSGGPIERLLDPLSLGELTVYLNAFGRYGGKGGRHEAELLRILQHSVDCAEIGRLLEVIRKGRNAAAHDRLESSPEELMATLRSALEAMVRLSRHPQWEMLVPQVVYVKERQVNLWGQHAVVIDEFGRVIRILLVEVEASQVGSRCYLYARNNPMPVAPVLISYRS